MQSKNRIEWIDIAKGYGIILVIIGHITTLYITVWIYSFHMFLFFFLSGYLFQPNSYLIEFCRRKIKTLLVPYIYLSIPVVINEYWFHYGYNGDCESFLKEVGRAIIQERYTPLWFISSLFCANFIFYLVYRTIKKQQMRLIIAFLFMIFLGGDILEIGRVPLAMEFRYHPICHAVYDLG